MQFKKTFIALLMVGSISASPVFAGGGATGGSTEFTQVANNALLAKSVANEATMIAKQVEQVTTMMNQYTTMLKNLQQLPSMVINEMLGPFANDLRTYVEAGNAVKGVYDASVNAQRVFETRAAEMANLSASGFDPRYYLAHEVELATRNAGAKATLDADMAVLKNYETRLAEYQRAAGNIGAIDSTIKGLQTMAALSSAQLSEMAEMNKQLRQQMAEKHNSDLSALQYAEWRAKRDTARQAQREANIRAGEVFFTNVGIPDPAADLGAHIR